MKVKPILVLGLAWLLATAAAAPAQETGTIRIDEVFALRPGVRFHDGTVLDARAAANALQMLLRAAVPARTLSPRLIRSVEPVGNDVVQITTVQPMVLLPSVMAAPATSILAPSAYRDGRVDPAGAGTGPFVLKSADPARSLSVVRNDAYWGGRPLLAGAEIRFIADATVRATQVRTHEADIARTVAPSTLHQLRDTPGVAIARLAVPRSTELLLNNARPPFDNEAVRRAVKAAIDTDGLSAAVYEGTVVPAAGVFLPTDPWASPAAKPAYDPALARSLLADAGIKPGTLRVQLLAYTSRTELRDVAQVVQAQLGEVGIAVDVRVAEYNAIEPEMLAGHFDMALPSRGHLTDGGEPGGFLNSDYGCRGTYNISHFCDPAVDAGIGEGARTREPDRRHALYRAVAAEIQARAVTVFLVNETLYDAVSSQARNYRPHPLNYEMLVPGLALD